MLSNGNEIDSFDMSLVPYDDMNEFEDVCRVIANDVREERENNLNDDNDDSDSDDSDDDDDDDDSNEVRKRQRQGVEENMIDQSTDKA